MNLIKTPLTTRFWEDQKRIYSSHTFYSLEDFEKLLAVKLFLEENASEIRIFSRDEEKQFVMKSQLRDSRITYYLGDIRYPDSITPARHNSIARVYEVDHKYMRDTNEFGHRLFYSMSIVCQFGNKYPWEVTIENMFAPGLQGPKGGLVPKADEKSSSAKCTFRLNDMEWVQRILTFGFSVPIQADFQPLAALWYPVPVSSAL